MNNTKLVSSPANSVVTDLEFEFNGETYVATINNCPAELLAQIQRGDDTAKDAISALVNTLLGIHTAVINDAKDNQPAKVEGYTDCDQIILTQEALIARKTQAKTKRVVENIFEHKKVVAEFDANTASQLNQTINQLWTKAFKQAPSSNFLSGKTTSHQSGNKSKAPTSSLANRAIHIVDDDDDDDDVVVYKDDDDFLGEDDDGTNYIAAPSSATKSKDQNTQQIHSANNNNNNNLRAPSFALNTTTPTIAPTIASTTKKTSLLNPVTSPASSTTSLVIDEDENAVLLDRKVKKKNNSISRQSSPSASPRSTSSNHSNSVQDEEEVEQEEEILNRLEQGIVPDIRGEADKLVRGFLHKEEQNWRLTHMQGNAPKEQYETQLKAHLKTALDGHLKSNSAPGFWSGEAGFVYALNDFTEKQIKKKTQMAIDAVEDKQEKNALANGTQDKPSLSKEYSNIAKAKTPAIIEHYRQNEDRIIAELISK